MLIGWIVGRNRVLRLLLIEILDVIGIELRILDQIRQLSVDGKIGLKTTDLR